MTIDPETLMAYADGELDPIAARRVERAIAEDPALAEAVERHRRLRTMLASAYAPFADDPLPDALRQSVPPPRLDRHIAARAGAGRGFRLGGAIAASLAAGVLLGQLVHLGPSGPVIAKDDGLVASGRLAEALDRQLVATQASDAPVRMIVSFRDRSGALCRAFAAESLNGIACREDAQWALRTARAPGKRQASDYRQAGSATATLLAEAQEMMGGAPLDAAAERRARAKDWR